MPFPRIRPFPNLGAAADKFYHRRNDGIVLQVGLSLSERKATCSFFVTSHYAVSTIYVHHLLLCDTFWGFLEEAVCPCCLSHGMCWGTAGGDNAPLSECQLSAMTSSHSELAFHGGVVLALSTTCNKSASLASPTVTPTPRPPRCKIE